MFKFSLKQKSKAKKIHNKNRGVINPHKHWMILLEIFFTLVAGLILFSLYLLFQIRSDQVFQAKPTLNDKKVELNSELEKSVTKSFDDKAQKEKELIDTPPSYPDPSL